jgi:hypothetical protein
MQAVQAARLLQGLESGAGLDQAQALAAELDPVLLYVVVRFLRETHPADDPAASAVLERVMKLMRAEPRLVQRFKAGERDPVASWFASGYTFREFRGRGPELLALIAAKLES